MWREYEFKGKPGDPRRRPRQFAPYHLRLDWLMWFAALSPRYAEAWFAPLLTRLLPQSDLLASCSGEIRSRTRPPPDPRHALPLPLHDAAERRETGAWWVRQLAGDYLRPMSLTRRPA